MTSPLYKSPIPLNYLDTDTAMTANSDVKVPSQKAVKAYADTKLTVVTEANLSLADNTTANASTSQHGLLKKLSNVATEFMNGVGSWVTAVTLDAVQTLTNKTLTSPVINTPTGDVVTPTGTQTLTNKTIASHMAYADSRYYVNTFTHDQTTTGDVGYTGVGFTPKCIIMLCLPSAGNMSTYSGVGFAYTAGGMCLIFRTGQNNYSGTQIAYTGDGVTWGSHCVLKTFDADGFTLTWGKDGTPPAGSPRYIYLAIR